MSIFLHDPFKCHPPSPHPPTHRVYTVVGGVGKEGMERKAGTANTRAGPAARSTVQEGTSGMSPGAKVMVPRSRWRIPVLGTGTAGRDAAAGDGGVGTDTQPPGSKPNGRGMGW